MPVIEIGRFAHRALQSVTEGRILRRSGPAVGRAWRAWAAGGAWSPRLRSGSGPRRAMWN